MLYEAIKRLKPGVYFELSQDGTHNGEVYISRWDSAEPQPTQAEIDAMIVTIQAEQQTAQTEAQQLRTRVVNLAQSAVGVQIDVLTAAQRNALLAALLWKAGAIDKNGAIRPLQDWVK